MQSRSHPERDLSIDVLCRVFSQYPMVQNVSLLGQILGKLPHVLGVLGKLIALLSLWETCHISWGSWGNSLRTWGLGETCHTIWVLGKLVKLLLVWGKLVISLRVLGKLVTYLGAWGKLSCSWCNCHVVACGMLMPWLSHLHCRTDWQLWCFQVAMPWSVSGPLIRQCDTFTIGVKPLWESVTIYQQEAAALPGLAHGWVG